jgi:polyhydroxyalkanoate synthesis repressor PhaR
MSEPTSEQPEVLRIKKYPNRRYYDATRSCHLTLEDIYGLIREGHEVQITDSKTGQDITARMLAQIIIEMDPLKLGVFPVPLLHGLLRSNEQAVTELARKYFENLLGVFLTSQKDLGGYFGRMIGLRNQPPTFADWARMMWGPLGVVPPNASGARSAGAEPPGNGAAEPAPAPDLRHEMDQLRDQLETLRRQLAEAGPKPSGRRPKKRP